MVKRIVVIALATVALSVPARAQQQPPTPGAKPAEQPQGMPRPEVPGTNANVRLDLTITDQSGPGEPVKKTVTMLVADRATGSIRSSATVRTQGRVQINVDARPTIVSNSQQIRLTLGLEYNPRTAAGDSPTEASYLNEQITLILENGKPLVISQAADPASDRKISVEVRATISK